MYKFYSNIEINSIELVIREIANLEVTLDDNYYNGVMLKGR